MFMMHMVHAKYDGITNTGNTGTEYIKINTTINNFLLFVHVAVYLPKQMSG